MIVTALAIPADHPAYAGHFPGQPVLPGVVLLDATLHALECAGRGTPRCWEVASMKFQSAVLPGEELTLQHEVRPDGAVRFAVQAAGRVVASGLLTPSRPRTDTDGEQS